MNGTDRPHVIELIALTGCDEKTVVRAVQKTGFTFPALAAIAEVHRVRGMVNRSCRNCEYAKVCALEPEVLEFMRKIWYGARINEKVLEEVRNESRKDQVQAPAPNA